jgi:MFS family permease
MPRQSASEPDASQSQPPLFTGRFVLLLVYQVIFGSGWSVFLLLPKFMTTELHATSSQIGATVAISGIGAVLGVPIVGPALARIGRKPMLQLGVAVTALSSLAFIWVHEVGFLLYALQLAQGLGFVFAFNAAGTLSADYSPPSRLSQGIGIFGASNIVTNALAPSIAEIISASHGWTPVWIMSGSLLLLSFALSAFLDEGQQERTTTRPSLKDYDVLLDPLQARMITVSICVGATFCAMVTFHQPYALSLGIHELRSYFIGFTCAAVFVRVVFGSLGDRFGRQRVSIVSLLLYAGAAASLTFLRPGSLWVFGVLQGTAHGVFYPVGNALVVQHATPAQRGLVLTAFNGGFHAGVSLGVFSFGLLAEVAGYPAVFVMAGVLAVIAAAIVAQTRTLPVALARTDAALAGARDSHA